MARRARRCRDQLAQTQLHVGRRRRYEAVLRMLGAWESFERTPSYFQQGMLDRKYPDPVLKFDAGVPHGREHRPMREAIEAGFRGAEIEVDGAKLSVRDFLSVVVGLTHAVRQTRAWGFPEEVGVFLREARPRLDALLKDRMNDAIAALYYGVQEPLVAHSRLDLWLLNARLEFDPVPLPHNIRVPWVVVHAAAPEVRNVVVDGAARPMYRAMSSNGNGVNLLSWTGDRFGGNPRKEHPVYVQSHALRQLPRRVDLPRMQPYLESWLVASLAEPTIVERQGDDLLVEFRIHDDRLGYLIVTPLEDLVAVRTFKFLTMENTPVGRKLGSRLRLTRREVDWLGLHELSAFTRTDLRDDPLLRKLMEECGCGHLFSMKDEGCAPTPKAFAGQLRRYLGLAA